jgi:thioredoxin 1
MAGEFVTAVSDAQFEKEVLQSEQPVLVDRAARWHRLSTRLPRSITAS